MTMQPLYVFTTYRPWSAVIAHHGNSVENCFHCCRVVPPGNLIAVHVGKTWDASSGSLIHSLKGVHLQPQDCPTGIVAIARFLGNLVPNQHCGELEPYRQSDWYQGGIGWVWADVVAINPVSCPGQQGIWPITTDNPNAPNLLTQVHAAYRRSVWDGEEAWNSHALQHLDKHPPGHYRTTPPGEPTVADLIVPGDTIQTNYSSRLYIVESISAGTVCGGCSDDWCVYNMPPNHSHAAPPTDICFPVAHHYLSGSDSDGESGRWHLSELVAVNGRILHAFPLNSDEIWVVKRVPRPLERGV
ncbi:MAG: hypothetical protein F6K30_06370 [Cyanothece sp. SIO2G6]|nr:hypothetical protein [Cyanothece sp. SIO2G6]